jgi:hypothetical protein
MDMVFWLGLGLGALISVPLSITANLWTDKVRDLLDKRRKIRLSNTKSKEVKMYFFVRTLREGDPTSRILFDEETNQSLRWLVFGMFCFLAMTFLVMASLQPQVRQQSGAALIVFIYVLLVLCAVAVCWSLLMHTRTSMVRWRLRQFKTYETDIRVKWGDDALEELHPPHNHQGYDTSIRQPR